MKKVSLLPSLFTTGNLFCGTYAIILTFNDRIYLASWFIFGSIFFDFVDGQIARAKNMSTRFGFEYDSLADLASFGFAPAIMVYYAYLNNMGRMGAALFFIYIACTALRLARFNAQKVSTQKISFTGLPTPAASGFIASIFILKNKYPIEIIDNAMPIVLLVAAALMVSNLPYPATGMLNLWKKKPFLNLVALILCSTMIFLHLELFLFLCFLGYVVLGSIVSRWTFQSTMGKSIVERSEHEVV